MTAAKPEPNSPRVAFLRAGRAAAYAVAWRLPPSRADAFLKVARRVGELVIGRQQRRRAAAPKPIRQYRMTNTDTVVTDRWKISPQPAPIATEWPEAPLVEEGDKVVRGVYHKGAKPPRYDIELFEALNAEYESKPLVPLPPLNDPASRAERARRRLLAVHAEIDLANRRVLEIGCGTGYEVWYVAHHFGSDAYGVDVQVRRAWDVLAGERVHFECADLAVGSPYPNEFFDRIISFAVWEHVTHPYAMLQRTYDILRPGGIALIKANLHRGAMASHLYRDVYFPYPHLLFDDEVIREFYRRRGQRERGASWVNRVTWAQYERYFDEIGFRVHKVAFDERPLDEEFYRRFEDVLGRYPRFDLTKDFFEVVLERRVDAAAGNGASAERHLRQTVSRASEGSAHTAPSDS